MRRLLLLSAAVLALTACDRKADASAAAPAQAAQAVKTPPPLDAAGLPKLRPGLWRVTGTDENGGDGLVTRKRCIGPDGSEKLREMLTRTSANCKTTRGPQGASYVLAAVCDNARVKTDVKMVWTGGETAFDMKMTIGVTPPGGKTETVEMVDKGLWIGACPAGMQPGDETE